MKLFGLQFDDKFFQLQPNGFPELLAWQGRERWSKTFLEGAQKAYGDLGSSSD